MSDKSNNVFIFIEKLVPTSTYVLTVNSGKNGLLKLKINFLCFPQQTHIFIFIAYRRECFQLVNLQV